MSHAARRQWTEPRIELLSPKRERSIRLWAIKEFIKTTWQMRFVFWCGLKTNHAQRQGNCFCRCCYKMYPLNEETRKVFWAK